MMRRKQKYGGPGEKGTRSATQELFETLAVNFRL
jgi:hypothetical protein